MAKKPKCAWTFEGACYVLLAGSRKATIYPLKHSMMPPLYHCRILDGGKEIEFFVERKLRTAKALCEEKVRAACESTSQR